ncbi:MAG TPA: hypothetical protein VLD64_01065 [Nitrosarchaeum sp.]|nr:hypothetical protein [Nitrosarchaeum sp.]
MKNSHAIISDDTKTIADKTITKSEYVESKNKTIEEKRLKLALSLRKL